MPTHALLEPIALEVTPGDELTCRLTVRNTGRIVEEYAFEVHGEASFWTEVQPPTANLYPGDQTSVTLCFRPPRSPVLAAGEVPFSVSVVPSARIQDTVAPEGIVHILPFTDLTTEISPHTSQTRRRARHEVAVDNRGNVPIAVAVQGEEPDGHLLLRSHPATLTVPPGQTKFAALAIHHRRILWRGTAITRPFHILVKANGQQPAVLEAASVQTALVPRVAPRAIGALAAALVALLAAWFLIFKPTVESAAQEAVRDPLAKASQRAASVDRAADSARQQADAALRAAGGPSGAVSLPPPQPSSSITPIRIPLNANAVPGGSTSGDHTSIVPADATLVLTDLVLQNPQGDAGRVEVLAEGTAILTLSMANFRDIDYHFVSPIEVAAGKKLSLTITCQTPGPPLPGVDGGRCRTWLLASGVQRTST
ncbi:MAG: hypothetical protein JXA67_21800 [Micromonosporaceae bacterium]|nr:hypothetical protein [Micromonosporaceae bacterium]